MTRRVHPGGTEVRFDYTGDFTTELGISHPAGPAPYVLEHRQWNTPHLAEIEEPVMDMLLQYQRNVSPLQIDRLFFRPGLPEHERDYTYLKNGWLDKVVHDASIPAQSQEFDHTYDGFGRLAETLHTDHATGVTTLLGDFSYDLSGDLQTALKQNPTTGTYVYNYPLPGSTEEQKGLRAPISATDGVTTELFERNDMGQLTRWEEIGGDIREFTYDGLGTDHRGCRNG